MYKNLIEWVAIQYHYTLDLTCLYLARPLDLPKYSTDAFNVLDGYPSILQHMPA